MLPGLFQAADRASLDGQRRSVRLTAWRLVLAALAALTGTFSITFGGRLDYAAIGTALAFIAAAVLEQYFLRDKPDRSWYDGRAVAESVKTLAWRYSVGANPFPKSLDGTTADTRFNTQLLLLLDDAPDTDLRPTSAPAISAAMRTLRAGDLATRKRAYLTGRITDQQNWYANKADYNRRRAKWWRWALFLLEVVAAAAALARVFQAVSFDLTGIFAALMAGGVAWLGVKQHDSLARAYTLASHELSIICAQLEGQVTEERWAAEVRDAEEAISREHTMWRASRSGQLA
ncbi:MAG TPA: DUF4231 domain-containing protein [Pseudonocardiaceae bacterium]|nr:DUF4231 domain-containing protein [Pseudonocardiaceae bacterium]